MKHPRDGLGLAAGSGIGGGREPSLQVRASER